MFNIWDILNLFNHYIMIYDLNIAYKYNKSPQGPLPRIKANGTRTKGESEEPLLNHLGDNKTGFHLL